MTELLNAASRRVGRMNRDAHVAATTSSKGAGMIDKFVFRVLLPLVFLSIIVAGVIAAWRV